MNTNEYAKIIQRQLDRQVLEGATSGWMEENASQVTYNGGSEIKLPKMSLRGLGSHDRVEGYAGGAVTCACETFTLTQDRGRRFRIDAIDVDEDGFGLAAANVAAEFQRTRVIPEIDAYRYSKLADAAGIRQTYTPNRATILSALRDQFVNESGLFSFILSSKLPVAKRIKRWVISEVLPVIGKPKFHDTMQKPDSYMLEDPAERAKRWIEEETERIQLRQKVEEDAPKVLFANAVEASKASMLIGDLAKLLRRNGYKTNQKRLLETLRNDGFLGKSDKSLNQPTQRSVEMGLFDIKESVHVQQDESVLVVKTVKVTGKGQIYFLNKYLGANKALGRQAN